MKIKNIVNLALTALVVTLFTSCDKVQTSEPLADKGQTIVKFTSDYNLINVDFVPNDQSVTLFDLRRDAPNNAELNRDMTVIVTEDMGIATAYDPALLPFPSGMLSFDPSIQRVGNNFTFKLKGGTFATELMGIVKNANTLNLSNRYATAFKITTVDADGKITAAPRTIVVEIGAKNAWDGVYNCTWTNYHPTLNTGYTGDNTEVHLITSGANKVKIFWPLAGVYACPAVLGGGLSYFGAQEPEFTINPTDVTVQNSFVGAVTFYTMGAGFNSRYDPASKTFFLKWGYSYLTPGVWHAGCREWTQTITYVRAR